MRSKSSDQEDPYQSAIDELSFWESYAKAFPPGSRRSQARLKEAIDAARQKVSEASKDTSYMQNRSTVH